MTWYDLNLFQENDEDSICAIDVSAVQGHAAFSKLRVSSHVNDPFSRFTKET